MIFNRCVYFFLFISTVAMGQDSLSLKEIQINASPGTHVSLRLPASVALIDSTMVGNRVGESAVPVLNSVAGVRMEERSPGSYRLSIRGSLLRSPFGIRNIKVYIDEFAFTNAGGETYLNLLDVNCINSLEILKGPDGSLYGANSGGVIRINPVSEHDDSFAAYHMHGGSYGTFGESLNARKKIKRHTISIGQAWQSASGYRENSAMDRKYFSLADKFAYAKGYLKFLFFYSDLFYQTPGGLTLSEFESDPKKARPATRSPGAVEQKAGIFNKTFFGGVVNNIQLNDSWVHVISLFGSATQFKNPFITNFETRNEKNAGARSWLEFKKRRHTNLFTFKFGGELQYQESEIKNYSNNAGTPGLITASDDVQILQSFGFIKAAVDLSNKFIIEGALSYNYNHMVFNTELPVKHHFKKKFIPQLMPKLSASYLITQQFSLRAIVSRGYSPPSLQETRASNMSINTSLQPEYGWNFEAGTRINLTDQLWIDGSFFHYLLSDAIVRRTDSTGNEFFMNEGNIIQDGAEVQIQADLIKSKPVGFFRNLQINYAFTYYDFKFGDYRVTTNSYSGNRLTGVPLLVSVAGINFKLSHDFYFFAQYNFTDKIPLNDLNSVYSAPYNLVVLKIGKKWIRHKFILDLNVGVDNLLDEKYSPGNDLNAFNNRYYNAAAPRNYFMRMLVRI